MKVIISTDGEQSVENFGALLLHLYGDLPALAADKRMDLQHSLDPKNPTLRHVQWCSIILSEGSEVVAHACIVIDERLPGVAHVGFVETHTEAATALFKGLKTQARSMGARTLRGPINFNTWQDFRAVGDSAAPPFFLEPYARNVPTARWRGVGFEPRVEYVSYAQRVSRVPFGNNAHAPADSTIELVRPDTVGEVLAGLHDVALSSFRDTWSFIPITEEEFAYTYALPLTRLDLFRIFVARERAGTVVGFLVSALDRYQADGKSLVVKSMAVRADHQKKGIGSALFAELHMHALARNIQSYVFSTIQTGNAIIHHMIGEGEKLRVYEVGECRL